MQGQQLPLGDDKVGQAEQAEELRLVLRQPFVADLPVAKPVLDHMEWMLDLCSNARFELLGLLEQLRPLAPQVKLSALAGLHGHVPLRPLRFFSLVHAPVARIAEGDRLIAVKQCTGLSHVADVGRRADHRVHKTRMRIDANMRLHPEEVSRPRELPPQPLAEPYVTLSRHTAPVIRPEVR